MTAVYTILLIDSDPSHAAVFHEEVRKLEKMPFRAETVTTLAKGIARCQREAVWAIFLNLSLPDSDGVRTFTELASAAPAVPILILGRVEDEGLALQALRLGAKDYILANHFDPYSIQRAIRNMLERETAEEVLFGERERARVTLDSIGDAVLSTDLSGHVRYLNRVAEKMTGWTRAEATGKPLITVLELVDGETRLPCPNPMQQATERDTPSGLTPNCILIRRDGLDCAIEDSVAPIHDRQGMVAGAVIVFRDVSKARATGIEMSYLAQHDVLTRLPNRLLFKDRLSQAIAASHRSATQVAVLYLDVDDFKRINDSLGHAMGDNLLQSISQRLLTAVRASDTVSRHGGDEFVILLSELASPGDAAAMASRILEILAAPHDIAGNSLHVTVSIGVAIFPHDGEDAETLIANADCALYQAKENGRNCYQLFERHMNVLADRRRSITEDLRYALDRNEFVMYYQPKVSLATGKIAGAEALVRWHRPGRGLVGPLDFISLAEESGLMIPIGQWILRESCRQASEWHAQGSSEIPISVNVSAVEFRSDAFLEGVRIILEETGLPPFLLELELTETVLMRNVEFILPVLHELRAMGVRLAIDDFGTGYSSLSYLRRFPIDTLKIDRSFMQDGNADASSAAIIGAVINLGKSLGHHVIIEGIESFEQIEPLVAVGADEGQGFYFSRPVNPAEFADLLSGQATLPDSAFVHLHNHSALKAVSSPI